jgi:hypothetical protein
MPTQAITLVKSKRIDDDYAIDATGDLAGDALKGLCLTWNAAAPGTIPNPLQPNQVISVQALRSSLVERAPLTWDSHLVVSSQIFGRLRDALNANYRLRLTITHQASSFTCQCLSAPPALREAESLAVSFSESLRSTDQRVGQIEQEIAEMKAMLANALLMRPATPSTLSNGHDEYVSMRGVQQ